MVIFTNGESVLKNAGKEIYCIRQLQEVSSISLCGDAGVIPKSATTIPPKQDFLQEFQFEFSSH